MNDDEFDTLLAKASKELEEKQDRLGEIHGIGNQGRFHVDYEKLTLQFFDRDTLKAQATILPIGTYALTSEVFQWAWANKQFSEHIRADSARLKGLYELTALDFFRNERGFCEEAMCWQTAAIACMFLGAEGAYRIPHGKVHSYVLLTAVRSVA
jgi:hypothetical protein